VRTRAGVTGADRPGPTLARRDVELVAFRVGHRHPWVMLGEHACAQPGQAIHLGVDVGARQIQVQAVLDLLGLGHELEKEPGSGGGAGGCGSAGSAGGAGGAGERRGCRGCRPPTARPRPLGRPRGRRSPPPAAGQARPRRTGRPHSRPEPQPRTGPETPGEPRRTPRPLAGPSLASCPSSEHRHAQLIGSPGSGSGSRRALSRRGEPTTVRDA
jgi:hypothetical protein